MKINITGDVPMRWLQEEGFATKLQKMVSKDMQEDVNVVMDNGGLTICSDDELWNYESRSLVAEEKRIEITHINKAHFKRMEDMF